MSAGNPARRAGPPKTGTSERTVRAAVIGLGYMGRVHVRAYQRAAADGLPVELVAVCDRSPDRLAGCPTTAGNIGGPDEAPLFDPRDVRGYPTPEELLADGGVDLVSVCTHTESHVEVAMAALKAGKHALVEKPVATSRAPVERLAEAAAASGRLCMPAMCMRFWPGWTWLREVAADGRFGRLVSIRFERVGSRPDWGDGFYADPARCGGALVDLHIHDVDFLVSMLGVPRAVMSVGTEAHVSSSYLFDEGPGLAVAEGGWMSREGFPFRMRYVAEFEGATAEFDLARDPALRVHGGEGPGQLPAISGYDGQIRHLVGEIASGRGSLAATLEEAVRVMGVLEAERESLRTGGPAPVR